VIEARDEQCGQRGGGRAFHLLQIGHRKGNHRRGKAAVESGYDESRPALDGWKDISDFERRPVVGRGMGVRSRNRKRVDGKSTPGVKARWERG